MLTSGSAKLLTDMLCIPPQACAQTPLPPSLSWKEPVNPLPCVPGYMWLQISSEETALTRELNHPISDGKLGDVSAAAITDKEKSGQTWGRVRGGTRADGRTQRIS